MTAPAGRRLHILLLVAITLFCYYPTLQGGPNSLDDYKMLMDFELRDQLDLEAIFRPGTGLYYRPLIILSFWFDKMVWRLEPSFMLLENILLHLGSVLLLYGITNTLTTKTTTAFGTALLFALHPLATESLNWVSGRTDPQAVFFHLGATLLLLRLEHRPLALLCGVVLSICGMLSKEMSFVFIAANGLLLLSRGAVGRRRRATEAGLFLLPFIVLGVTLLLYRRFTYGADVRDFSVLTGRYDIPTFFDTAAIILGFYLKKLVIPVPLNFAIAEVAPGYRWLGIAALVGLAWGIVRRPGPVPFLFGITVLLLIPAVLLGLARVAWTPFAERYAYQALPFFCLAVAAAIDQFCHHRVCRTVPIGALAVIIVSAGITVHRNLLWQNKVAFFEQTVRQSPSFATVRNELAVAYLRHGRLKEAKRQLEIGISLDKQPPSHRNQILYANLAMLQLHEGDAATARRTLAPILTQGKAQATYQVLATHAEILRKELETAMGGQDTAILTELLETFLELRKKTGDAFYLYEAGKTARRLGDTAKAARLFAAAARQAPAGAAYQEAAGRLAETMTAAPQRDAAATR